MMLLLRFGPRGSDALDNDDDHDDEDFVEDDNMVEEQFDHRPDEALPPPSVPPAPQLIFRENPSQLVIPGLQTTTRSIG